MGSEDAKATASVKVDGGWPKEKSKRFSEAVIIAHRGSPNWGALDVCFQTSIGRQ
jgi:hypothetical protein